MCRSSRIYDLLNTSKWDVHEISCSMIWSDSISSHIMLLVRTFCAKLFWCRVVLVAPFLLSMPMLTLQAASPELHIVAELTTGPGNITVTPQGRIIISMHQFFNPDFTVAEVSNDGGLTPFPNAEWAQGSDETMSLDSVLGIQSDSKGVIWMLDNGLRSGYVPKLVAWDSVNNHLHRIIHLPEPVSTELSFVNDLAVDENHQAIYIADPAPGELAALIVVDLKTGYARRVLQGHKSVVAEDIDLVIEGEQVLLQRDDGRTVKPRIGVNPIVLDGKAQWLYFAPMSGTSMYRIATEDLINLKLSEQTLAARVQRYSDKPVCDGVTMDKAGVLYISDIAHAAIGTIGRDSQYHILKQDVRLSWPDAFSFGPKGWLYVVANQLHKTPLFNAGKLQARPPFYIFKISTKSIAGTDR